MDYQKNAEKYLLMSVFLTIFVLSLTIVAHFLLTIQIYNYEAKFRWNLYFFLNILSVNSDFF